VASLREHNPTRVWGLCPRLAYRQGIGAASLTFGARFLCDTTSYHGGKVVFTSPARQGPLFLVNNECPASRPFESTATLKHEGAAWRMKCGRAKRRGGRRPDPQLVKHYTDRRPDKSATCDGFWRRFAHKQTRTCLSHTWCPTQAQANGAQALRRGAAHFSPPRPWAPRLFPRTEREESDTTAVILRARKLRGPQSR